MSLTYKTKFLATYYFHNSIKKFVHCGDCRIYCVERKFCDCGLIYRLSRLDFLFASILYPKFEAELYFQETGKKLICHKKETLEQKKSRELLESVFGPMNLKESFIELKCQYDEFKKVLNSVFPKKVNFPNAYRRLDRWLEKELAKT